MGKCMNITNRKNRRQVPNNNTNSFIGVIHNSSTSHLQLRRRRRRRHRLNARPTPSPEADEFDGQQRIRESTPCNSARDLPNITKENLQSSPMSETNPMREAIEAFFSAAECRQQQLFKDKYNFDFLNDKPIPGRFEWEKVIA